MFGVGFSELVVILLVALIVIGPERLPKVARTFGLLVGRLQRYINGVKAEISREMAAEEFRELQQKINQEVLSAEQATNKITQTLNQQVQQINSAVAQPIEQLASTAPQQTQPGSQSATEQK